MLQQFPEPRVETDFLRNSSVNRGYGEGCRAKPITWGSPDWEVGRISAVIATAPDRQTPLTRKIAHFSHILLYTIMALATATVLVGILRGQPPLKMFMAAVALAVGAIQEGLPAALSITLTVDVARMAKRRAVICRIRSLRVGTPAGGK